MDKLQQNRLQTKMTWEKTTHIFGNGQRWTKRKTLPDKKLNQQITHWKIWQKNMWREFHEISAGEVRCTSVSRQHIHEHKHIPEHFCIARVFISDQNIGQNDNERMKQLQRMRCERKTPLHRYVIDAWTFITAAKLYVNAKHIKALASRRYRKKNQQSASKRNEIDWFV